MTVYLSSAKFRCKFNKESYVTLYDCPSRKSFQLLTMWPVLHHSLWRYGSYFHPVKHVTTTKGEEVYCGSLTSWVFPYGL